MISRNHSRLFAASAIILAGLALEFTLGILSGGNRTQIALAQNGVIRTDEEASAPPEQPSFAPDRLIVKFRSEVKLDLLQQGRLQTDQISLDRLLVEQRVQSARSLIPASKALADLKTDDFSGIYILRLEPGSDVLTTAGIFDKYLSVEWAEPDYLAYAAATPNDPHYTAQWGLAKIGAPAAWDVTHGSSNVAIAIIDSGLEMTHPDLSGKLWVNPGEIAGNSLDDDNNGYVDDVNGWDFANDDKNPADDNGHGTQVAGVAAANTNNAIGVTGLCWNCRIMPVKVMQSSGVANYSDIATGVVYAAQKGAKVINISLGGYSNSNLLHTAIQSAVNDYGAMVVGGAGNDNSSNLFYPAAYEEVLAVAGTDQSDVKAAISNYGQWVDVSAPAVAISTTFMGGDYGTGNGTSFSAPFVSGLAGLVRSLNPSWDEDLVRAQIVQTADSIDALNPSYTGKLGSGRIDAADALTVTPHPILAVDSTAVNGDPSGRPTPGETAMLQVTLGNTWLDASGVQGVLTTSDAYVTINTGSASYGGIPYIGTGMGSPLYSFQVASGAGYNHSIPFNLHLNRQRRSLQRGLAHHRRHSLLERERERDHCVG